MSLNITGKAQVQLVAKRLADESVDRIYTSDYLRAKETADAIAALHQHVPLIIDPDLRERHSGVFSHRPVTDKEAAQRESGQHYRDWKPEGGESLRDVKERAHRWYVNHRTDDKDLTVVVVSHGFFLSMLLEWALEDGTDVEEKEKYRHHNGALTILNVPQSGTATPIVLNDINHLKNS